MINSSIKELLRQRILQQLTTELTTQTKAAALARDEAISEESRPENKYDTHSQEAAYLAEGQAKLAVDIAEAIAIYQGLEPLNFNTTTPLALGALVLLTARHGAAWYFLGPRSGGLKIDLPDLGVVCVLTPQSPLGRQLIGRRVGDTVTLPGRSGPATISQVN